MMNRVMVMVILSCFAAVFPLLAQDETSPTDTAQAEVVEGSRVQGQGFRHQIAVDRKIEKYGGLYEPEALDVYMKRKFDALSEQIAQLQEKLEAVENAVQSCRKSLPSPKP